MKVKIAKRVVMLCVALTIAFVVTFGRKDGQPQIDGKSEDSGAENLALRLADGSDKAKSDEKSDLPVLADIPVFGPTDDASNPTSDAMAALPALPSLDSFVTPESSDSAPDASATPTPDDFDALPSLDLPKLDPPPAESNAPATDTSLPDLAPLPDMNSNATTNTPQVESDDTPTGLPPALAPLSITEPNTTETKTDGDNSLEAFSASLNDAKNDVTDTIFGNRPVEPFPPKFTPTPVAPPTLPSPSNKPLGEPVAKVAQLPSPLNSNVATSPFAPTPTPTRTPTPTYGGPQLSAQPQTRSVPKMAPTPLKPAPPVATAPALTRPREPVDQHGARRHRVTVRDTLESISQQYFGSPAYAGEIYQANRRVLARPDLLMLDTQLTIPNLAARNSRQTRPAPGPTIQPALQPVQRQAATDPFLALPTGLPASQPAPRLAPNANNTQAIPETRKPVNPLPAMIEDGSNQNRQPRTRLVPVPSA